MISLTSATRASSAGRTGSIMAEWNACDVCRRRADTFRAARTASSASIASNVPEATHKAGPFTAAIDTSGPSSGASSASGSRTASIVPRGSEAISCPRAATSPSASSRLMTPARHAATNSPTLCPIIAAGVTFQLIQVCAVAYSTAKIAGCAIAVVSSGFSSSASFPAG